MTDEVADSSVCRKPLPLYVLVEIVTDDRKEDIGKFYDAFDAFCMGEENEAKRIVRNVMEDTKSSKVISVLFKFVYGVLNDTYELRFTGPYSYINLYRETEQFKHLRKRFFDAFVLFLKRSGYFDEIMLAECQDREVGQTLNGADLFRSIEQRLFILEKLFDFPSDENIRDMLKHISKIIGNYMNVEDPPGKQSINRISDVHLIPYGLSVLLRQLKEQALALKERQNIFDLAGRFIEYFIDMVKKSRIKSNFPEGKSTWVQKFLPDVETLASLFVSEWRSPLQKAGIKSLYLKYIELLLEFYFEEINTKPDGNGVLIALYNAGLPEFVKQMAEQYKDFNVLCKVCCNEDYDTRQNDFDRYKKKFVKDDFEMYLLRFLDNEGHDDILLQQQGERAAQFMKTKDNIAWRQALNEDNYSEASILLLRQVKTASSLTRKEQILSLARLLALADDKNDGNKKIDDLDLTIIEYQRLLPVNFIRNKYPNYSDDPLMQEDLLDLWREFLTDPICGVEEFKNALFFIGKLKQNNINAEDDCVKIWIHILQEDDWMASPDTFNRGFLAQLIRRMISDDPLLVKSCLPNKERFRKEIANHLVLSDTAYNFIKKLFSEIEVNIDE